MDESRKSRQQAVQLCTRDITCTYILHRLETVGTISYLGYENTLGSMLATTTTEAKHQYQYADAIAHIGKKQHTKTDLRIITEYGNHCWGMDKDSSRHFVNSLVQDVFSDGSSSWIKIAGILEVFHQIVSSTLSNRGNLQFITYLVDVWISAFQSLPLGPDGTLYLYKWLSSKKGWNSVLRECEQNSKLTTPLKASANDPTELANYIPFQSVVSTSPNSCISPSLDNRRLGSDQETIDEMLPKSATIMSTSDLKCSFCRGNDLKYMESNKKVGKCVCGRWRCLHPGCNHTYGFRNSIYQHLSEKHKALSGPKDYTPSHCMCGKQKKRDKAIGKCKCGRYYCALDNCENEYAWREGLFVHRKLVHGIAKPRSFTQTHCKCGKQKRRDKPIGKCVCGRFYCAIDNCEKEYSMRDGLVRHQRQLHFSSRKE